MSATTRSRRGRDDRARRDAPDRLASDDQTAQALTAALARPLANELTHGQALRFGALLHDIAKARTQAVNEEGRVSFWATTSSAPRCR